MKKLKVAITSGRTREYVDEVRVLTNISSGRLGAEIANKFLQHGHEVTYVAPRTAVYPAAYFTGHYSHQVVTDTNSVFEVMKDLVPKSDVVVQVMAVSDFTFNLEESIKVSSGSPEAFIEHMRKTIKKTPKIISNFKKWNPNAVLVGFKFTVGESKEELISIGKKLMDTNSLDMVFANDKEHMKKKGDHIGTLIMKDWHESLFSKKEIAESIYNNVVRISK